MKTEIQTFNFQDMPVRTVIVDNEPWFVAVDAALILGYRNSPDATRMLDDDEKGTHILPTPGGAQEVTIISESGLFNLVIRSRRDEAKPFRRWVTGEVLPTIRKTGSFSIAPAPALPQSLPEALRLAADLAEQREQLAAENAILAPKAEQFQALMEAKGTYSVAEAAKLLHTGENRLFKLLRERQIFQDGHRSGGDHHNVPYQRYLDAGYFELRTRPRPDGKQVTYTPRVTPKGLAWLERGMREQMLLSPIQALGQGAQA